MTRKRQPAPECTCEYQANGHSIIDRARRIPRPDCPVHGQRDIKPSNIQPTDSERLERDYNAELRAQHTCTMTLRSTTCSACNRGVPYPHETIEEIEARLTKAKPKSLRDEITALEDLEETEHAERAQGWNAALREVLSIVDTHNGVISAQTTTALGRLKEQGKKTGGGDPFGYRAVKGTLRPVPSEQKVIAFVKSRHKRGFSFYAIARELNEHQELRLHARGEKGKFWPAQVKRMVEGQHGG